MKECFINFPSITSSINFMINPTRFLLIFHLC
jgi:uncharacterized protein (DUF2132 family)